MPSGTIVVRAMFSPMSRWSICSARATSRSSASTRGVTTWRRLKARSCFVNVAARSAALMISWASSRRGSSVERLEQQLCVAPHRHQQIVEVVRDAAGEAPDRFELLRLAQLVVALLRFLVPMAQAGRHRIEGRAVVVASTLPRSGTWRSQLPPAISVAACARSRSGWLMRRLNTKLPASAMARMPAPAASNRRRISSTNCAVGRQFCSRTRRPAWVDPFGDNGNAPTT